MVAECNSQGRIGGKTQSSCKVRARSARPSEASACHPEERSQGSVLSITQTVVGSARPQSSTGLNDETTGNGRENQDKEERLPLLCCTRALSGHFRQFRRSGN